MTHTTADTTTDAAADTPADTTHTTADTPHKGEPENRARRRYVRRVVLLAAVVVPIMAQMGILFGAVATMLFSSAQFFGALGTTLSLSLATACYVILVVVFSACTWLLLYPSQAKNHIPESLFVRLAPAVIPPMFYLLVWTVVLIASGFSYIEGPWAVYYLLSAPYLIASGFFALLGLMFWVVPLQIGQALLAVVMIQLLTRRNRRLRQKDGQDTSDADGASDTGDAGDTGDTGGARLDKRAIVTGVAVLVVCLAAVFSLYARSQRYVDTQNYDQMVGHELPLGNYQPFFADNNLEVLPTPSLMIDSNYPRLDGATAALPVYGAMAQAIYRGLDEESAYEYVNCSTTNGAYEQLIDGNVDVFFGAQPSESQQQLAQQAGVELELTPLGREAFVFFVNKDNPVDSLTLEQIQDIYQKKITNWTEVGGTASPIIAYQRNEGSGSQTIMEAKVMGDKEMATPLRHESVDFMGGMVHQVAEYENAPAALGYSFRYYVTGMLQNSDVKLLSIDGIAPTVENIRNGSYPFTIDFYAVTAGTQNPHVPELLDWILSDQGQAAIEQCGYVALQ
jgi:phosphate transport system substrate-binding protein